LLGLKTSLDGKKTWFLGTYDINFNWTVKAEWHFNRRSGKISGIFSGDPGRRSKMEYAASKCPTTFKPANLERKMRGKDIIC